MITKRLSLIAFAAAFAVSSSAAMLQTSRPALADADDHHPSVHRHTGGHWVNGEWIPNNANWNGPAKHHPWKHRKLRDKDHDRH